MSDICIFVFVEDSFGLVVFGWCLWYEGYVCGVWLIGIYE